VKFGKERKRRISFSTFPPSQIPSVIIRCTLSFYTGMLEYRAVTEVSCSFASVISIFSQNGTVVVVPDQ